MTSPSKHPEAHHKQTSSAPPALTTAEQTLAANGVTWRRVATSRVLRTLNEKGGRTTCLPTVLKTLAYSIEDTPLLAVLTVTDRLDHRALSGNLDVRRAQITRADDHTLARLRMAPGGIAPVQTTPDTRIVFDTSIGALSEIWCGSGDPSITLQLQATDLVKIARHPIIGSIAQPVSQTLET